MSNDLRSWFVTFPNGSNKSHLISETSPLCFRNLLRVTNDIISGDERWGCDTSIFWIMLAWCVHLLE
ncbi:hypothetical protein E3N88_29597 [Mikania micrantha]|uniref:Uncharacterized protein n=1 Tax=Mikania micrantha TaxID=192012 RepID=A0A5N6MM52_9ASTR|nr:hypothetical protein E3N88_29597 [Mikania micrantha]